MLKFDFNSTLKSTFLRCFFQVHSLVSKNPRNKSLRLRMPNLPLRSKSLLQHLLFILDPDPRAHQPSPQQRIAYRSPHPYQDLGMRHPCSEPTGGHALGLAEEVPVGEDDNQVGGVGGVLDVFVPA